MSIFNIWEQKQQINKNNNKEKKSVNKIREQNNEKKGTNEFFKIKTKKTLRS